MGFQWRIGDESGEALCLSRLRVGVGFVFGELFGFARMSVVESEQC
jgi:hypothetical protein